MSRFAFVTVTALLMGCATQPDATESDEELLERARTLGLSDCVDAYLACTGSPRDCISVLSDCIDGASSGCSAGSSVNGESRRMECTDGDCTCTENDIEVGTCQSDSCALPGGCCDAFFGGQDPTDSGTPSTDTGTGPGTTTDSGAPPSTDECGAGSTVNGVSQRMDCIDGDCTCTEDGVELGTCPDDECLIPGGCCDAFFGGSPTPNPTPGSGSVVNCSGASANGSGDSWQVDCGSGTCTCFANGVEVGQCATNAEACAIPGSCCDAFF
ncbi:MAG: hypothetical protein AAGA48_03575 [Myxococcota bacterium]